MRSRYRKAASVVLVAAALVGLRTASAAGVDGIDVLVGDGAAEGCGSDQVQVDYDVEYEPVLVGYGISAVRLSGLDERCEGREAIVTLSGPGGVALAELSAVVGATDVVVPAGTPVGADQLTGVSVVLVGSGG